MKKYERLDINERLNLEKLKDNDLFKKENGMININKIAKQMNRSYSVIWEELNMFDNINDYNATIKAQKIPLILSKTLDIYKKPWFYLLFIKLFLQKPLFDKGFWLHQEFSTKLKKNTR